MIDTCFTKLYEYHCVHTYN